METAAAVAVAVTTTITITITTITNTAIPSVMDKEGYVCGWWWNLFCYFQSNYGCCCDRYCAAAAVSLLHLCFFAWRTLSMLLCPCYAQLNTRLLACSLYRPISTAPIPFHPFYIIVHLPSSIFDLFQYKKKLPQKILRQTRNHTAVSSNLFLKEKKTILEKFLSELLNVRTFARCLFCLLLQMFNVFHVFFILFMYTLLHLHFWPVTV